MLLSEKSVFDKKLNLQIQNTIKKLKAYLTNTFKLAGVEDKTTFVKSYNSMQITANIYRTSEKCNALNANLHSTIDITMFEAMIGKPFRLIFTSEGHVTIIDAKFTFDDLNIIQDALANCIKHYCETVDVNIDFKTAYTRYIASKQQLDNEIELLNI